MTYSILSDTTQRHSARLNLDCAATGQRSYKAAKNVWAKTVPEMVTKQPQGGGRGGYKGKAE